MTTMLIVSIHLVALYVGATIWKHKELPESISAMVYDLSKPWRWIWSVWLATVTVMISPALTAAMPDVWYGIAGHIFIVLLAMTAAMPLLPGYHNKAHYICGIAAGIMSQVCVALICPWWMAVLLVFTLLVVTDRTNDIHSILYGKTVFLSECACYVSLVGALLTH